MMSPQHSPNMARIEQLALRLTHIGEENVYGKL
jgi:hypothetical protein